MSAADTVFLSGARHDGSCRAQDPHRFLVLVLRVKDRLDHGLTIQALRILALLRSSPRVSRESCSS